MIFNFLISYHKYNEITIHNSNPPTTHIDTNSSVKPKGNY